jgi:hypothetical protein
MEYRKAIESDFSEIAALQNKNLASALNPSDYSGGFLSTAFSVDQFKEMNDALGITVCLEGDHLCGYLCATTLEFNQHFPLQSVMIDSLKNIMDETRFILDYPLFFVSPACIDRPYRGTEVLSQLIKKMLSNISQHYERALTVVSADNHRSMKAIQKHGMKKLHSFEWNQKLFHLFLYKL